MFEVRLCIVFDQPCSLLLYALLHVLIVVANLPLHVHAGSCSNLCT